MRCAALLLVLLSLAAPALAEPGVVERAFERARWAFDHAQRVRYVHVKQPAADQVTERDGEVCAVDDCSGFVSWVLSEVAPQQYAAVRSTSRRPHPLAENYAAFFNGLDVAMPQDGWLRVASWRDLRRGDFIAWSKKRKNAAPGRPDSGHVMMVYDAPAGVQTTMVKGRTVRFVPVFVLDSSSVRHFPPEKLPPLAGQTHRNGLGEGTVRLVVDADDRVIGYWEGSWWGEGHRPISGPTYSPMVRFGRLTGD